MLGALFDLKGGRSVADMNPGAGPMPRLAGPAIRLSSPGTRSSATVEMS